jgi:hypothetical protein
MMLWVIGHPLQYFCVLISDLLFLLLVFVTEMIFNRIYFILTLVNWRRLGIFVLIMPKAYLIRSSFPPRNKRDLEKISAFFQRYCLGEIISRA